MAPNPNPSRIATATWRLWEESAKAIGSIRLGGIYVDKPGYHGTRSGNDPGDYSVQYPGDRQGPANKAAALDLTFPDAQAGDTTRIRRYSQRLADAARRKDPRLWRHGIPIIREVIGNFGGRARAWDLYRQAFDNRDPSHEWHIHLSITRLFVNDWNALAGVLAVLKGESMALTKKDVKKIAHTDGVFNAPETWLEEHPDADDHWTLNTYFRSIRDQVVWARRSNDNHLQQLEAVLENQLPQAIADTIADTLADSIATQVAALLAERLSDIAPDAIAQALARELACLLFYATSGCDDSS